MRTNANFHASFARVPARQPNSFLKALLGIDATYRQRRALERLDGHLRRDVGLSEDVIDTELKRPLWDAPTWWR